MSKGITFDEQEFLALYNASGTRLGLIAALEEMRPYLGPDDSELAGYTDSWLDQLKAMTDDEYGNMELDSILDDA